MENATAAAVPIDSPDEPAPRLQIVRSGSDELRELREARDAYARAIDRAHEVEKALVRAQSDADVSTLSKVAAKAYLENAALDESVLDPARARAAAAALPELRSRMKEATEARDHARAAFRAAIIAIMRAQLTEAARGYARTAIEMGKAWHELSATHRTLAALGSAGPDLAHVAVPVCAIMIEAAGRGFETHEAHASRWYVPPDLESHHNAATQRSFEQQRDLRALVGDDLVPWPFP